MCQRGFKGKDCTELEFCELERHCPDGSECKNLEDGYECVSTITFDGDNIPLAYNFNVTTTEQKLILLDQFELTYRSRSWGTAFYASYSTNYFVVFIMNNHVIVEWNIFGNLETNKFKKENFRGQWLTIYLKIKDNELKGGFKELVNDDTPNFIISDFDTYNFTEIFTKGNIYVGGSNPSVFDYQHILANAEFNFTNYVLRNVSLELVHNKNYFDMFETHLETPFPMLTVDLTKTNDRFKASISKFDCTEEIVYFNDNKYLLQGCLGEIRIGKILVPFFPIADMYKVKDYPEEFFSLIPTEKNKTIGCVLCHNKDCFNEAKCDLPDVNYPCQCLDGFAGDDCAININECEINQCRNNATCIDKIGIYECQCPVGYEGVL